MDTFAYRAVSVSTQKISAMRKKLPYEAPDSEALLFRAEENFCQTFPSTVTPGKFGGNDPDKYFDETEDVW